MTPVPGFTRKAIGEWAASNLSPGCLVTSDGLACFNGVTDAGCLHNAIVVGGLKPKDLPEFNWINTILGNLKTFAGQCLALGALFSLRCRRPARIALEKVSRLMSNRSATCEGSRPSSSNC